MKIAAVYAAMTGYEHSLNSVSKIISNTLTELNVEVELFNIAYMDIHYFDGYKAQAMVNIFESFRNADGIIFMSSAQKFAPCGIMQVFIEHFDESVYGKNILEGKYCMNVVTSKDGSEEDAANYINKVISSFAGIEVCRMPIGAEFVQGLNKNAETKEMIERYTEDFYRILRQKRKYFINRKKVIVDTAEKKNEFTQGGYQRNATDAVQNETNRREARVIDNRNSEFRNTRNNDARGNDERYRRDERSAYGYGDRYAPVNEHEQYYERRNSYEDIGRYERNDRIERNERNDFQPFDVRSADNIQVNKREYSEEPVYKNINDREMEELLGDKTEKKRRYEEALRNIDMQERYAAEYRENDEYDRTEINPNRQATVSNLYKNNAAFDGLKPRMKTCRQKTESLYHYFQPQKAKDMNAVIQVNVKGDEKFEGFITIKDGECTYNNGVHDDPNVTIFVESNVWEDILDGRYSTQKAFMIGQLKVRGNFILLSKFDQLFKMNE